MRVALVTGITGQDGGYLVGQLTGQGFAVHGLVRTEEQVPEPLLALGDAVELHTFDLTDDSALRQVLAATAPTEVYNLAGISSVAVSWSEPALTAAVNGTFVARLLQLLWDEQEHCGERTAVVQASSAEIFAGATSAPQDESTPMSPRSPYGASKAFAHHLVEVFRERGLTASNAILYNHESPRRPTSFVTRKITSTVAAIAEGRADRLVLSNLDARRDWGWAPEYLDAMVRMAAQDVSHTVEDFVGAAFARVGMDDWAHLVTTDPSFERPVDAVELVGDPSRAQDVLGWEPKIGFDELVGRMVDADLSNASH